MKAYLITLFTKLKDNKDMSLDEIISRIYDEVMAEYQDESDTPIQNLLSNRDEFKKYLLETVGVSEYDYYTEDVNPKLKEYVENSVYSQYEKNDKAHGIVHIREVVRRAFALNETLGLNLDKDMIYAIASCHDIGKYIDHKTHERIAGEAFIKDENMKKFFSDSDRVTIKEAIEDHRSSKEDTPRSTYGKLISSADRNTTIEMVFIRSFFVGQERTPDMTIEEFLDFTFHRLSKRYGEENPENMFYNDDTYDRFLAEMRALLKDEKAFKDRYCAVNRLVDRNRKVIEEKGYSM